MIFPHFQIFELKVHVFLELSNVFIIILAGAREEKFIFIDEDYVGVVLGRHLRNIRKIEHETRVRMKFEALL